MKGKIYMKKYFVIVFGFMIVGFGSALALKANAGMGAWDAVSKSTSDIFQIEVGTMSIFFNSLCVLGQILILKKEFNRIQLLQIPFSIILGMIINYVAYDFLLFELHSLGIGVLVYIVACIISAIGVSMVMLVNKVTFALEGLCMAISLTIRIKFHFIRQIADFLSVLLVLLLTYIFSIPLSLGVGTLTGMLMFGPCIGYFMKVLRPLFLTCGLLDNVVEK